MKGLVKGPRRWRAGLLATVVMLGSATAVVLGQGTAGASSYKPFSVVICYSGETCTPGNPPVIAPGASASSPAAVAATILDETTKGGGLKIGSVNLSAPTGVTITSASLGGSGITATCGGTTPSGTSCITSDGSTLELRSLGVAPGTSIQVALGLSTPAPSATSCTTTNPCAFSAAAKQSNDYSGPPGNNLNLDTTHSQLAIVTSSTTSCTAANGKKTNTCSTSLGDGGASGSAAGTVSFTTSATGTTGGVFYQSIDYGTALDHCGSSGTFNTQHSEYINGVPSGRTFTVTVTTTNYAMYQAELCAQTSMPFMAKPDLGTQTTLVPAAGPLPQPDGTTGYEGLLPDCSTNPNHVGATVKPTAGPCVLSRSPFPVMTDGSQTTHTIVASYPAGFDSLRQSN